MDSVHVVDKCLHGLVNTISSTVDSMLQHTLTSLQAIKVANDVVIDFSVIHVLVVLSVDVLKNLYLLDESAAHKWSKIEVECRYCLPAMHFVLCSLHRDACNNTCSLDALGRT